MAPARILIAEDEAIDDENEAAATSGAFPLLGYLATVPNKARGELFGTLPGATELLSSHPIHLPAWRQRVHRAADERADSFFEQVIIDWVVHRHLRVATRKLAAQEVHTFKFAPEEDVLVCLTQEDLEPASTNPRLRQGSQILIDLGYIVEHEEHLSLSPAGRARLGVSQ